MFEDKLKTKTNRLFFVAGCSMSGAALGFILCTIVWLIKGIDVTSVLPFAVLFSGLATAGFAANKSSINSSKEGFKVFGIVSAVSVASALLILAVMALGVIS